MALDHKTTFVDKVAELLITNYPARFPNDTKDTLISSLNAAYDDVVLPEIKLSTVTPDYERVILQLMQEVEKDETWYDTNTAATGQALMRMIASDITYSQFAIERSLQEAHTNTATSAHSVFEHTRMLGVRIRRKKSSYVDVTFTRQDLTSILTIPKYQVFEISGVEYYNKDRIIFNENENTLQARLYQGSMIVDTVISSGLSFQRFEVGNEDFNIADDGIIVEIDGVEWRRSEVGLWNFRENEKVFFENTTPRGNVEITFGTGAYGALPKEGTAIVIRQITTLGEEGNNTESGLQVKWGDAPSGVVLEGVTISSAANGTEAKDFGFYKAMASHIYASQKRSSNTLVTRQDYAAVSVDEYPGVRDAVFQGQAELNPGLRSWMNLIGVTLLTDEVWTTPQWNDFEKWLQERAIYKNEYLRMDPEAVDLDIEAEVYCYPHANLTYVKSELTKRLREAFSYRRYTIGYSWYKSDITEILEGKDELSTEISFVKLVSPTTDVEITVPNTVLGTDKILKYVKLNDITLTMAYTKRGGYAGRLDD